MRHALVIARRELAEKRFVALAAAAFAVLPFLLSTIPAIRARGGAADVIATGAALLSMGFTGGLALMLGSSMVGRDLSEGRLSFYFARPLGTAAIWFGKVAAGLALIAGTFLIIAVPSRIAAPAGWNHTWGGTGWKLALIIVGASCLLFFLAHVIGSFIRSRSAWIAVDFAAFCLAAFGGYFLLRELFETAAIQAMTAAAVMIGSGVVVALIGGGAWQLERGRTDRKRSHFALSQFVWTAIAGGLVLAAGFVAWIASARPNDLTEIRVEPQRQGPWLVVAGKARGRLDYMAAFVYNSETGGYKRLPVHGLYGQLMFTRDGNALLLGRHDRRTNTIEVFRREPGSGDEVSTGLTLPAYSEMTPTDDGSRIVSAERGRIVNVYDVAQRRSLVSARLPENAGYTAGMYFVTPSLVRLYKINRDAPVKVLRVFELDVASRALRQTGQLVLEGKYLGLVASDDGSRVFVRTPDALIVADGRTAAPQMTISGSTFRGATFLRDGGTALIRGDHAIEIRDAAGALTRTLPLSVPNAWSLRETPDGNFVTIGQGPDSSHTYVVDGKSGAVVQHIPALPVGWRGDLGWFGHDPRRATAALPALFTDDKRLLRWNYATKQAEVLLPRG